MFCARDCTRRFFLGCPNVSAVLILQPVPMNVKLSQGAVALGVLTLLFGGDLYGMFAGQSFEVGEQKSVCVVNRGVARLLTYSCPVG